MPEQLSAGFDRSRVTCISVGEDARRLLHTALAGAVATLPAFPPPRAFGDTFSARQWLRSLPQGQPEAGPGAKSHPLGPELLAVVDYRPDETWSLTTLMSQLLDLEPQTRAHVVLVTEGWRWTLPVLVADFPRLSLISAGVPASDVAQAGGLQAASPADTLTALLRAGRGAHSHDLPDVPVRVGTGS